MKIDKTNYQNSTEGKFRSIPAGWAKALTTVGLYTPCYLGGKIWTLNHVSNGRSDHWSGYWVSDDGEHLIRISDHWSYFSKRKHKETGVKKCKKIRTCTWSLKQRPHVVNVGNIKVAGGYIRFDKMTKKES